MIRGYQVLNPPMTHQMFGQLSFCRALTLNIKSACVKTIVVLLFERHYPKIKWSVSWWAWDWPPWYSQTAWWRIYLWPSIYAKKDYSYSESMSRFLGIVEGCAALFLVYSSIFWGGPGAMNKRSFQIQRVYAQYSIYRFHWWTGYATSSLEMYNCKVAAMPFGMLLLEWVIHQPDKCVKHAIIPYISCTATPWPRNFLKRQKPARPERHHMVHRQMIQNLNQCK